MNYDFFASKDDKIEVLDFIFNETDLQVHDLSSPFGEDIESYKSRSDITSKFDLDNKNQHFQLWSPTHGGKVIVRKIVLDPKHCEGHTFRFATEGCGLIQLYFNAIRKMELEASHLGHFNEKGARKWESYWENGDRVDDWNWTEIQKTSRKIQYHIRSRLSVAKIGSRGLLPGAATLQASGVVLR